MNHYPKYLRTGYFRKGTPVMQQIKKQFYERSEFAWAFIFTGVYCGVGLPLMCYKLKKEYPTMGVYKNNGYTIIRDAEVKTENPEVHYNPDELEKSQKRLGK